jgi:hypothetical protein
MFREVIAAIVFRDPFEATKAPASALFARNAATLPEGIPQRDRCAAHVASHPFTHA